MRLLSKTPLGTGAYGSVFKVQCDDLICAAKLLHPTLVAEVMYDKSPQKKFLDEIEFLGFLRHPNIVQYLGVRKDPDTNLPMLLMELMDGSLTQFLERSAAAGPLPLPKQLDICHDVALALSFLHANGVIHRDLSSNNVLMLGNRRVKVSDFGMAKLHNRNASNTMCPGTDSYMPPEAVQDSPTYTEKIDCFSLGVLAIQVMIRRFPSPGPRTKQVTVNRRILLEPQSEYNRREKDIMKIPADHVLRGIACDCLKENESERPSASLLCSIIFQLKEKNNDCGREDDLNRRLIEKEKEVESVRKMLEAKLDIISTLQEEIRALNVRNEVNVQYFKGKLGKTIADNINFTMENGLLQREKVDSLSEELKEIHFELDVVWKEGPEAPCPMTRSCDAVVCGSFMYVIHQLTKNHLYVYNCITENWSQLPDCPTLHCSLANVKNALVTVGGFQQDGEKTNNLYTLSTSGGQYSWTIEYPPMLTKRDSVITASSESYLIVMGGVSSEFTKQVEVLAVDSKTWYTASSLLTNLHSGSAAVCGGKLFVLGGWVSHTTITYSTMVCSIGALIKSCQPLGALDEAKKEAKALDQEQGNKVWCYCSALPVTRATCVSYHNRILVLGGQEKGGKPANVALTYNAASNSWTEATRFSRARSQCIAAVLPSNELLIVGGYVGSNFTKDVSVCEVAKLKT